jgi:hypothetical protein
MIEFISLGSDCAVRYHLENLGLTKCAYPFDWVQSEKAESIIKLLTVENILENYIVKNTSHNFPKIDECWVEEKSQTLRIVDSSGVIFVHDLSNIYELPSVREKYRRRLERFKAIMLDASIKKILFRVCKNPADLEYLTSQFDKLGYVNYEIRIETFTNCRGSDWRKMDYDWHEFFRLTL